jgi:hypothetical protein
VLQLVVFLLASAIVALVTINRVWLPAAIAIGLYVSTPWIASSAIVGVGIPGINLAPPSYFVTVVFVVQVLLRPSVYARHVTRPLALFALLIVFVVSALYATFASVGTEGLIFIVNQTIVPLLLFSLIRQAIDDEPTSGRKLALSFIFFAALSAITAVLVWTGWLAQPFERYIELYWWYGYDEGRGMGLADHPLILGMASAIAIPLLVNIRRWWLVLLLVLIYGLAILVAQARTSLLLGAAGIVFVLLRVSVPKLVRILMFAAIAVTALIIAGSEISAATSSKIENDTGSGDVRLVALGYFLNNFWDFALSGGGTGASYNVARMAGLSTSVENPLFAYAVDYGLFASICYFVAQAMVVFSRRKWPRSIRGGMFAGAVAIIGAQTWLSLGTVNYSGGIIWITLALAAPTLAAFSADSRDSKQNLDGLSRPNLSRGPLPST